MVTEKRVGKNFNAENLNEKPQPVTNPPPSVFEGLLGKAIKPTEERAPNAAGHAVVYGLFSNNNFTTSNGHNIDLPMKLGIHLGYRGSRQSVASDDAQMGVHSFRGDSLGSWRKSPTLQLFNRHKIENRKEENSPKGNEEGEREEKSED